MLKAKQESFRLMNDDLSRKQKQLDEQTQTIKSLKEKIDSLEEQHAQSRLDLEKRLNDKEIDLQTKIASFEANLHEGRHYFEEILNDKENTIKEKTTELSQLKQKLNKMLDDGSVQLLGSGVGGGDEDLNSPLNNVGNLTPGTNHIQKFDAENLKNIKSLYEHQIELLKVKIEMLEKTCHNYQKGKWRKNKVLLQNPCKFQYQSLGYYSMLYVCLSRFSMGCDCRVVGM